MFFLIAIPVISCVVLFWRCLQIYAPSNVLTRRVRSATPRVRTVLSLLALDAALLVTMHVLTKLVERGAPGWLNLVVLALAWDTMKVGFLAVAAAAGATTSAIERLFRRDQPADLGARRARAFFRVMLSLAFGAPQP